MVTKKPFGAPWGRFGDDFGRIWEGPGSILEGFFPERPLGQGSPCRGPRGFGGLGSILTGFGGRFQ